MFWINLPVALVVGLLAQRVLPSEPTHPGATWRGLSPAVGSVLPVTVGVALLITCVLTLGETASPWASLAAGAIGLVIVVVVARRERCSSSPLIAAVLRRDLGLRVAVVGELLLGATQMSVMYLLAHYTQNRLHLTPLGASLGLLPMGLTAIAAAIGSSMLARRVSLRTLWATALFVGFLGLLGFAALATVGSYPLAVIGPSMLVGASIAAASTATALVGTRTVDDQHAGGASGVMTAAFQIGAALGVALTAEITTDGLAYGYLTVAVLTLLGLANLLRLPNTINKQCGARPDETTTHSSGGRLADVGTAASRATGLPPEH